MTSPTEKFQKLWMRLLWEKPDESFDSKLEELQELADEGADLSFPLESDSSWEPQTALYYLMFVYGGAYYTLNTEQCDQLLHFLLLNGVIPNQQDIARATVKPKVLEQLLYFAREEDIRLYEYNGNPLCLEVLVGFPSVRLDQESCYEINYTRKNTGMYVKLFSCLPIEKCLMDYATYFGVAITTIEERREVLRILKKNGSPSPRIGLMKEMLDLIDEKETRKRFLEAYDYWKSL